MRNSARVLLALTVGSTLVLTAFAELSVAAESSQAAFNNRCRTCHSIREGDNRLGPSLHNIYGAKAGSSGFQAYSQALRNSGVTWNEDTLNKFITNPDALIPGNNMKPFAGITDEAERAQIVDYLKSAKQD